MPLKGQCEQDVKIIMRSGTQQNMEKREKRGVGGG